MTPTANNWIFRLVSALSVLILSVPVLACRATSTTIAEVQGTGAQSPMLGDRVTVTGVITYDSRKPGGLKGFFLQQQDDRQAGKPAGSTALFIYTEQTEGAIGQQVQVTGRVNEYHGLTELTAVEQITTCGGASLPQAVPIQLPLTDTQREALEGMRVSVPQPLQVIDHDNLVRFGALTLAPRQQPEPTQILAPGTDAARLWHRQRTQRLVLDDGSLRQQPHPIPYPPEGLNLSHSLRTGAQVSNLDGVLDFRFGDWRLQPLVTPHFLPGNPRPPAPIRDNDTRLRLMSLNLGNYFNGSHGRFNRHRGAANASQWQRQTQRLVAAIHASQADILAATELENDGYGSNSAIAALANALGTDWRFVIPPGSKSSDGHDAIRVGLLYRSTRVEALGPAQRPDNGLWHGLGRPPLAQHFQAVDGGPAVRIVVTHLKSKRCGHAEGAERDQGDGQGCFATRRKAAAQALAHWLQTQPAANSAAGTLITGDLNSYAREWPLQVLQAAGYQDLINTSTEATAASFRFHGRQGTLDYSLADAGLTPDIVTAQLWPINAAEPRALDYAGTPINTSDDHALPWRCSDHDPLITDFRF